MTTAVTYDMQKLGEAVGILAHGNERLQVRLKDAIVPLWTLANGGGMKDKPKQPRLEAILDALMDGKVENLSDDAARELAGEITSLHSAVWHDAVWALEDSVKR